jgi:hypothetical protein
MAGPGYDLRLSVGPGDAVHLLTSFLSLTASDRVCAHYNYICEPFEACFFILAPRKRRPRHRWCHSVCLDHLYIVLYTASQHRAHVECGMCHGHSFLACPISKLKLKITTRGDNISPKCAVTASVCLRWI